MTDAAKATAPHALSGVERLLLGGLGLGWSPILPGTTGSLATAGVVLAAERIAGHGLLAAAILFAYGVAVTLALAGRAGGKDGKGDPSWVVSDEVAGQAIASAAALQGSHLVLSGLVAFLLFRILDIGKPPPIGRLERIPGGRGVLADDLAAGLVAAAVTWGLCIAGVV